MALPLDYTPRPLTPEEEALLLAQAPGAVQTAAPAAVPPPADYAAGPPPGGYDLLGRGGQGPFTTPTGWQHGAIGTGGGTAGALQITPLLYDDPIYR